MNEVTELETTVDDRCKECKKDWTKCGCCPIMMEGVKELKEINKRAKEKDDDN